MGYKTLVEITATTKKGILTNHFVTFYGPLPIDYMYKYSRLVLEDFSKSKIDDRYTVYFYIHTNNSTLKFHYNEAPKWNINTIAAKLMNRLSKLW